MSMRSAALWSAARSASEAWCRIDHFFSPHQLSIAFLNMFSREPRLDVVPRPSAHLLEVVARSEAVTDRRRKFIRAPGCNYDTDSLAPNHLREFAIRIADRKNRL